MAAARVYVGGIPHDCRERDLEKFFKNFGKLRDCLIKNGYGFVEFEGHRDADDAVYEMNGRDLMGMRVTVEHARGVPRLRGGYSDRDRGGDRGGDRRPPWMDSRSSNGPMQNSRGRNNRYGPPTRTPYRCVVENLSSKISWQDLKDYMRKAGTITFADAHRHRRNEGIVEFASHSDLKRAIDKLDDTELCGRRIRLINDYRRSSRSRSRSRSNRRSYSKSRSRSHSGRRSRSRSRSGSRSRSRSPRSRSRSRDRSNSKRRTRSRSRSRSKSNNRRSNSRSSKQSRSRSRSRTPKRDSHSRSRSRSRSPAPAKEEPQSNGRKRNHDSRSRSRSESWSPKKQRTQSKSRSRSRSASYSPAHNGDVDGHENNEDDGC